MSAPEFSRAYRLTQIRQQPLTLDLSASEDECAALARRFGLISIGALGATVTLTAQGEDVLADGHLRAKVVQACVATADPLDVSLDEPLALRFSPEPDAASVSDDDDDDEVAESSPDLEERDLIYYEDATIDIGEALAQTLLLSLDPYPRSPDADTFLKDKGVVSEEDAGPFGALARLRDMLDKN